MKLIREYHCEECGSEWEELCSDQEDPPECPNCGTPDSLYRKIKPNPTSSKNNTFSDNHNSKND